jgi:1-acyl-sn-glycerol-3-phosphate acyltransferase
MIASGPATQPPFAATKRGTDSAVASPSAQLDRLDIQGRTLETIRQLLAELGSQGALEELARRGGAAHLERDLGLGSLERVELMLRLGNACGVHLPDQVVAEADTVNDLIGAILQIEPEAASSAGSSAAARYRPAAIATQPASRPETARGLEAAETLTDVLRYRARTDPGQPHIFLCEEDGQTRTITCGELLERARAVGVALASKGLEPGGTVAIMLPTCADFFFSFFGVLLAGGIPVPIYPPFRADRIEEYAARQTAILQNAEARFLITFRQAEGLARILQPLIPSLREVVTATQLAQFPGHTPVSPTEARPAEMLPHRARAEDIAFLQYTSGSTGDPKGVVLTHANLLANIRAMNQGVGFGPDDVAVSWLPLYHDMGLIGAWLAPLCFSFPVVVLSPLAFLSRPERWLWAIHHHRGTLSPAPNFAFELCTRKIADRDIEGLNLSCWRGALNGAEAVRPETLERFAERFAPYGFRREILLPVYGLAEATLAVAAPPMGSGAKVDRIQREAYEREGRAVVAASDDSTALAFASVGRPLPSVEVRIANAEGGEAGERVEGRLWFRGPSATSGYYRNPEATREILREDGWVDSGDLAYRVESDLYITGRAKDIIIKAGRNLCPHEVEEIATRVNGVRPGCVVAFGIPDQRTGTERFVVAAELRDPSQRVRIAAEITRQVAESLGLPPDVVELLPTHSIPKTSSGKLRRSETRRLYLSGALGKRQPPAWLQMGKLAVRGGLPRIASVARKEIRRAFEFLYGLYALGVCAVLIPLLWFCVSIAPRRRATSIIKFFARLLLASAGVPVRVVGAEVLSQLSASGPWIFAPNHSSYVDIVVMVAFLPPDARFVAKGEATSMPIFGSMLRRTGHFTFNRSDAQARLEQAKQIEQSLRRGESVVVYPEGTFTSAEGIRPFQLGAFKTAVDTRRPICPVSVCGARRILRDKTYLPKPGRITLTFGPLLTPQSPEGNSWPEIVRLRDAAREAVGRNTGEPLL